MFGKSSSKSSFMSPAGSNVSSTAATPMSASSLDANWLDSDDIFDFNVEAAEKDISLKNDGLIYLIDMHSWMQTKLVNGDIPVEMALQCCLAGTKDKIISSPDDYVGVLLYGCQQKNNENEFDYINEVEELQNPSAAQIMRLNALAEGGYKSFGSIGGDDGLECNFYEALWYCSIMFQKHPNQKSMGTKRIFLLTNNDAPNNEHLRELAEKKAHDLQMAGVSITLFPLDRLVTKKRPASSKSTSGSVFGSTGRVTGTSTSVMPSAFTVSGTTSAVPSSNMPPPRVKVVSKKFNVEIFFSSIISDDDKVDNVSETLDELRKKVRAKETKKRNFAKLRFFVTPELDIAVSVYSIVTEAKPPSKIWVSKSTNEKLLTKTTWKCKDTGQLLREEDVYKAFTYADKTIIFTPEELKQIRSVGCSVGIKLVGFKPRSALKEYYQYTHSLYLFPNEEDCQGSTTAFIALLQQMLAQNKIGIAKVCIRENWGMRFYALLPHEGTYDDEGKVEVPRGIYLVALPYKDDFKSIAPEYDLDEEQYPDVDNLVSREKVRFAKEVVNALQAKDEDMKPINYTPSIYSNPKLQKFYAGLQAIALDQDDVELPEDTFNPSLEGFKRHEELLKKFNDATLGPNYVIPSQLSSYYAKNENVVKASAKVPIEELQHEDLRIMNATGFNRYTTKQLKDLLSSRHQYISSNAKKAEVVQALVDYFQGDGAVKEDDEENQKARHSIVRPVKSSSVSSHNAASKKRAKKDEDEDDEDSDDDGFSLVSIAKKPKKAKVSNSSGTASHQVISNSKSKPVPSSSSSSASTGAKLMSKSEMKMLAEMKAAGGKDRPVCKYHPNCIRKNPLHFRDFSHPGKE